jgi:hypothetical protein
MYAGWEIKSFGTICQIKPPKSEARQKVTGDKHVSFLPMEDMGVDEKYVHATRTKPLSAVEGSSTYFANGDILLAKITPCFENGKSGIATNLKNGIGFGSSEYIVFRPNETLDKEWLYYFLSRADFRVEGAARMSGAVGHKRVSKEFIEDYRTRSGRCLQGSRNTSISSRPPHSGKIESSTLQEISFLWRRAHLSPSSKLLWAILRRRSRNGIITRRTTPALCF